jgi:hypothetical protein
MYTALHIVVAHQLCVSWLSQQGMCLVSASEQLGRFLPKTWLLVVDLRPASHADNESC